MHIVLVLVTVKPELLEEFEAALLHNARESVQKDAGCLRFDVSQQLDDPAKWILHEVYPAPEAHAAHRQSAHFLAYDAVAARAITEKVVIRARGRHPE
jgi:autoinducer 2-degrading protein